MVFWIPASKKKMVMKRDLRNRWSSTMKEEFHIPDE